MSNKLLYNNVFLHNQKYYIKRFPYSYIKIYNIIIYKYIFVCKLLFLDSNTFRYLYLEHIMLSSLFFNRLSMLLIIYSNTIFNYSYTDYMRILLLLVIY